MTMTIAEAFDQFAPAQQRIVQALAVYGRPVSPHAVSFLLQPFLADLDLAELGTSHATEQLEALTQAYPHLICKEMGQFSLQPDARAYVFGTLEVGDPGAAQVAQAPQYTQFDLLRRAAEYYIQRRKPSRAWSTIDDVQAQLNEFDLRCQAQDYQTAALLLSEISFNYLMRWGHYRLVVELRERLADHLDDPALAQSNLGELGSAYAHLGEMETAIACQQKALALARANHDRYNEGVSLTNLGNRYVTLGKTQQAVEYFKAALSIARERQDLRAEGLNLAALGTCYAQLGQFKLAMDYYDEALNIAREMDDIAAEGYCLSNLGNIYTALGFSTRAIAAQDQALAIARQLESRVEEARRLGNLAESLIADGLFAEAVENLQLGLAIDDETGYTRGKNFKGGSLAFAYLLTGDLEAARRAAESARQHDTPQNNHNVLALLGVIALRQGDREAAHKAFREAISEAEGQLEHNAENPDALGARGLALSGLALLEGKPGQREAAIEAYQAARALNDAPGLVQHALRLFDALAVADSKGMLAGVRPAVAGTAP